MQLVETIEVGAGGAASIEFTSIPQDADDLLLVVSAANTAGNVYIDLNLNGSATGFTGVYLYGTGSAVASSTVTTRVAMMPPNTWGTFGNSAIYIPNYTSSSNKSISSDSVSEQNATTGYQRLTALQWANTAAITSVKLIPSGDNFAQYSVASLYKITAA